MIKVVGIDPGLAGTGIGMVQGQGTTLSGYEFGSIKTTPEQCLVERLEIIYARTLGIRHRGLPLER
jgi:crossover junction endodeoxyribonuclease RuvC